MIYKKEKRKQVDRCNICGKIDSLTWDHVPPKSCYNSGAIRVNPMFQDMPDVKYMKEYQSGLRFRSLCNKCNNDLLGANYDLELSRFTNFVNDILQSQVSLPDLIEFDCQVNKLTRAICGHFLATINRYPDGPMYDEIRKYLCDNSSLPPKNRKLLFRVYPYSTVVINQEFLISNVTGTYKKGEYPSGTCIMVSCYPAAYVLCDEDGGSGLVDLFALCTKNIEDTVKIPILLNSWCYKNTSKPRDILWPCNIGDDMYSVDMMLGGDETIMGLQKKGFHLKK